MLKATALVVSARQYGNGYDCARFVLQRLQSAGIETELVNFFDYRIVPCQGCQYECENTDGLPDKLENVCPIDDDVCRIWEKVWEANILLLFVPTYRGYPPALWIAFLQRGLGLKMPPALWKEHRMKMEKAVLSVVVFASPHGAAGGEWTPAILSSNVRWLRHTLAAFEVFNNYGFGTNPSAGRLIEEEEIQRRLSYLAERTLAASRKI